MDISQLGAAPILAVQAPRPVQQQEKNLVSTVESNAQNNVQTPQNIDDKGDVEVTLSPQAQAFLQNASNENVTQQETNVPDVGSSLDIVV